MLQKLTNAGYRSSVRDVTESRTSVRDIIQAKRQQRLDKIRKVTIDLVVAWGLSAICFVGHLAHLLPRVPSWLHALHSVPVTATVSALALLGEFFRAMKMSLLHT